MFTPEERGRIRAELLKCAANDIRLTGAAITGSGAAGPSGNEDQWSDIDLAFGVGDPADMPVALADWTTRMYRDHLALHHVDVLSGAWVYRVFLLPGELQVDLAFAPASEFRALAPTFKLMFGSANPPQHRQPPLPAGIIGMGWLYALHARSCIARGKLWQAEYMISGIRDSALELACLRHNLPTAHGRGMDLLPVAVLASFKSGLVRNLDIEELSRAFREALHALLHEIRIVDMELGERLRETILALSEFPPT